AHGKLFRRIVRRRPAQPDELFPRDAQTVRVMRHVLPQHGLRKGVVACGNGCMRGEERRGAHYFQRFAERQAVPFYQLVDAFDADEGRMPFVAVVYVGTDAQPVERPDAAHAEQDFLPEAVFEVAAVEIVRDGPVLDQVQVVVRVEQVEFRTPHFAFPNTGRNVAAGERDAYRAPVAHIVAYRGDGELVEILRFVARLLSTARRNALRGIAVAVKQPHAHHRYVFVARLHQVVARQDT